MILSLSQNDTVTVTVSRLYAHVILKKPAVHAKLRAEILTIFLCADLSSACETGIMYWFLSVPLVSSHSLSLLAIVKCQQNSGHVKPARTGFLKGPRWWDPQGTKTQDIASECQYSSNTRVQLCYPLPVINLP